MHTLNAPGNQAAVLEFIQSPTLTLRDLTLRVRRFPGAVQVLCEMQSRGADREMSVILPRMTHSEAKAFAHLVLFAATGDENEARAVFDETSAGAAAEESA